MPRPGPRPYECVRRAWHSDRHQPIRGSLIQEIFRVVNEIHSSATKKNKEWQEKLPIVVLKAEEIMYSKANSEAEYMDLKTLWDRTNDAINTIIRRDESTETGDLLQPCIEAALNLGCTPRRASRSQRNSDPGCYLTPSVQDSTNVSPSPVGTSAQGNLTTGSQCISHCSKFSKPRTINSIHSSSKFGNSVLQNGKFPFPCERFPPAINSVCLAKETGRSSGMCSIYPLYYGDCLQSEATQFGCGLGLKSNSIKKEPAAVDFGRNGFSSILDASNKGAEQVKRDVPKSECDLSLRLGPLSIPRSGVEKSGPQEVEDVGSTSSREGSRLSDLSNQMDKELSFFPGCNNGDRLDSGSSKRSAEDEFANGEAKTRKCKSVCGCHLTEDQQFFWQRKLPHGHFSGRMRNAGS